MLSTRRQTILTLGAALLGGAAVPALAGIPDRKTLRDTPLTLGIFSAGMQARLAGLSVRLHNYRSNGGRGGHEPNASFIHFPGRTPDTFDIATIERGAKRYYLNNIDLERFVVRPAMGRGLKMILWFEGRGTEIKAHCRGTILQCPVGRDDSAPDIQVNHMKVEVVFGPRTFKDGLTFVPIDIDFSAEIRAGGICGGPDICNVLTHYRVLIRREMKRRFAERLGTTSQQEAFYTGTRGALTDLRIGTVHKVRVHGSNLVITHSPRS